MNLVEILAQQTLARPEAPAIIEAGHGITTFAELERRSRQIASLLRKSDIRSGDTILIFQPMSSELYAVLLAIFQLGAVAMFLDPSAGREHIERCCHLRAPDALIASQKAHLLRFVSKSLRKIRRKFVVGRWIPGTLSLLQAKEEPVLKYCEPCKEETPALLTFTSGSTGQPKATVRTHGFLLAQHRVLKRQIELSEGEVDLTTLPIFLLANLASGVTSVIPNADLRMPGSVDPKPIFSQITRHNITRCTAAPAFFERLLASNKKELSALSSLNKIYTGGGPVFPRLLQQLCAAAPQAKVEAVYGSTEAEPIAHLDARSLQNTDLTNIRQGKGLLAGHPVSEIRLRIVRDQWGIPLSPINSNEFNQLQLPAGQIGEIVVTGDHVLKTYLNGHGNTETKFMVDNEIWHRTGDAGKLDAEGRLWLLGRCAAKVQDSRGELYPFSVECVAMERVNIVRAAFVAYDEKRLLAVETKHRLDESTKRGLFEDLSWAKLDSIQSINHIPLDKRHNSKIDYPALLRILHRTPV